MQRHGTEAQSGLVYVLNNLGNRWSGTSVKTKWTNQKFKPVAWDGHDSAHPDERTTDAEGNAEFLHHPGDTASMLRVSARATRVFTALMVRRQVSPGRQFQPGVWCMSALALAANLPWCLTRVACRSTANTRVMGI
jgi:hypothetical protein